MKIRLYLAMSILLLLGISRVMAYCDTQDGPIVMAGKKALATNNVNVALIWVPANKEASIKKLFDKAKKAQGTKKQQEKEQALFNELVKIHQELAGGKFEGIQPAGSSTCPLAPLAKKAFETKSTDELTAFLQTAVKNVVEQEFSKVFALENFDPNNVAAGRAWADAYVDAMHHLKKISAAIRNAKE